MPSHAKDMAVAAERAITNAHKATWDAYADATAR